MPPFNGRPLTPTTSAGSTPPETKASPRVLTFNAAHDLVNFVSQDRSRASADGKSFARQAWSTPLAAYQEAAGYRLPTLGEGQWSAPEPEGIFTYIEFHLDDIHYNVNSASDARPPWRWDQESDLVAERRPSQG